jgi:PAS domain S-box-containing protein
MTSAPRAARKEYINPHKISDIKFRLLVENVGDVLWFKSFAPSRYAYVSPAFERIWGLPVEELYEKPTLWKESIHPDDRATVESALQAWFSGHTNDCRIEYRIRNAEGEYRWIDDHGIIIGRRNGKPYEMSGIARDITAIKADEMMRSRLAAVVESSDDAIITLDLDHVIQTWNQGAKNIFGYSSKEVVGKPISILRPPEAADDEAVFLDHIHRGKRIHHYETKRQRKDGQIIDISLTLSPLRNNAGQITGFSKISRDITEHKLAARRFHDLLEAAPDALIIVNERGLIQMVNAQAMRLFGYPREAMIGQRAETLVPKHQRKIHASYRQNFLADPHKRELFRGIEMTGRRQDGSIFPMEINLSQIQTAEGNYVISDIIDITDRKQAEQAIRQLNVELEMRVEQRTAELSSANEELRELIDMRRQLEEEILRISEHEQRRIGQDLHDDLGQQLAGAWMMSSVLDRTLTQRSAAEAASAKGISALLEKALAQTRSLARGLHPVSPADGGLMTALEELAARSSAMFGIHCSLICPKPVQVDDQTLATHLYRIAQEAVSNAVKHGRAKAVNLELSATADGIRLTVLDNGIGLHAPSANHQGMGLRIMRYRADMIHGMLTIEKAKKGGTHLICIVPTKALTKETSYGKKIIRKTKSPAKK